MKARDDAKLADESAGLTPKQMAKRIKTLKKKMYQAAKDLELERAAAIRDEVKALRGGDWRLEKFVAKCFDTRL